MSGGAATTIGTTFQEDVGTWLACLILGESESPSILDLGSGVLLNDLLAETTQPVDDLRSRTSADGNVFCQCKTSLAFSDNDETFISVLDQFIRQFSEGCTGDNASVRRLDTTLDRLVLVVSHRAPATIRTQLRDLLNRIRSATTFSQLQDIRAGMPDDLRNKLNVLMGVLRARWNHKFGREPSDEESLGLLRLIYVLPLDLDKDGTDRRQADELVRRVLVDAPERALDAWNTLLATIRRFSPARTGGDLTYFRSVLETNGLNARPAQRARNAIQVLKACSESYLRHLESFASIRFKNERIRIGRPVGEELENVSDDTVVIGMAGAGKSGVLWELARKLTDRGGDVLVLAVDQLHATSMAELENELRLPIAQGFVSTLGDWSGASNGYLIVDALDAARTTYGLKFLCGLMEQIRQFAPRWKVIASIREFDLRHSRGVRRLFQTSPESQSSGGPFSDLRHVQVKPLTDAEFGELERSCPAVAHARNNASDELKKLTCNLFNLRLLAELVEEETEAAKLSSVRTQVGLLDLFWEERLEHLENTDMIERALTACTEVMASQRSLNIDARDVVVSGVTSDEWLVPLASAGILLVTEPVVPGASRTIGFAHNILFDYAVARMLLRDLDAKIISRLADGNSQDLLLAIRPSLVMAFQRLWYASADRQHFWDRAIEFAGNPGVRLFGKIVAANVAATEFRTLHDVTAIVNCLDGGVAETAVQLMQYMWQAAFAARQRSPEEFRLWGDGAPEWTALADLLVERAPDKFAWTVRGLLAQMLPR